MSRPYGWNRDGTLRDDEAAILKASATDVIDGRPVNQIVQELNASGVRTSGGSTWTIASLTRTLRNPRLTGRRKTRTGFVDLVDVEPVIDVDDHERLLAVLEHPDRKRSAPKSRTSLLTGLVWCQRCGARMPRRGATFRCTACDSAMSVATLEAEVPARVLSRIASPVWRAALTGALAAGADHYRDEVQEADRRLQVLAETFGAGGIDDAALEAGVVAARAARAAAEQGLALSAVAGQVDGFSDEQMVDWWVAADDRVRRELIDVLLEAVDVLPADAASGADRVLYRWR